MNSGDIHPVASELLAAFADHDYFRSNKLCRTVGENDPQRCVNWAFRIASPPILSASPPPIVTETVSLVERSLAHNAAVALLELDAAATESWSSGTFCESSPYLQRVAARLAWAAMCLISHTTGAEFETQFSGVSKGARENAFTEMVNQSAMAIDMTAGSSNDSRLMIASSFSREMETLS